MKVKDLVLLPNFVRLETDGIYKTYFFKCVGCGFVFSRSPRHTGVGPPKYHNDKCRIKNITDNPRLFKKKHESTVDPS